ncbi:hypothetical protein N1851_032990 [Merluccius polli]|uniref:Uncharacterized protein n=1 Tax=Merluccius polli TaxID=89951 RepID=A0AA47NP24_MERPO|nr:hypothetical protein N1851_032990 [Merluccius polli]
MHTFYRGTIESILSSCITVWYGACTVSCRKTLQRIVRAAERIIGVSLHPLQKIHNTRITKAIRIAGDPTHPSHSLFSLLPSGRRRRSLRAKTSRLKDSFFHQAGLQCPCSQQPAQGQQQVSAAGATLLSSLSNTFDPVSMVATLPQTYGHQLPVVAQSSDHLLHLHSPPAGTLHASQHCVVTPEDLVKYLCIAAW